MEEASVGALRHYRRDVEKVSQKHATKKSHTVCLCAGQGQAASELVNCHKKSDQKLKHPQSTSGGVQKRNERTVWSVDRGAYTDRDRIVIQKSERDLI